MSIWRAVIPVFHHLWGYLYRCQKIWSFRISSEFEDAWRWWKKSSNFSCHLLLDRRYAKHSSLIQHAWSSNVKSEVIVTWDCYPAWHSYLTHVPLSRVMITGLSCSCNPLDGALKNRWKQGFGFFTTAYTVRMSKKSATKVVVTTRHLKPFLSGFRTLQWC